MRFRVVAAWLMVACVVGAVLGCSPAYHRADADREVYGVLARKQAQVLGAERPFSIEPDRSDPLDEVRRGQPSSAAPPPSGLGSISEDEIDKLPADGVPRQPGAALLTLRDALRVAARHSRDYQSRKEELYLAVLDLTLQRHLWKPQWGGTVSAGATAVDATDSGSAGAGLTMGQLLALGGEVSVDLATDLVKYASGGLDNVAASALAVTVLQPLWRNSGRLVARENLTQAERDTVYAVRSFARFRKTFCYSITSQYYGVLQLRDSVANEWQNYLTVRRSVERTAWLAAKGDLPPFQVDQARQDQLSAWDRWLRAVRQYQETLDRFNVLLALPSDAAIELDPSEVDRLRQAGVHDVPMELGRAVQTALRRRFDLLNLIDQVADSERKVIIAANGLAPDVGLTLGANVATAERKPLKAELSRGTYSAGIEAGLPLNRKAERNAYRRALIDLEAARREADRGRDDVALEVREAWRNLRETAARYRTQEKSLKLADRRVEGASELLEAGEAQTRDLLDALRDQLGAKNALTGALIDNTLARLALWRDTELLEVGENGVWQEVTDVNP